eukprot:TRINITY_DN791_c0_g1_i6.p2 TRINITY_DN791_c0_g1~~TRINITY_DN791_c0_g1_i6.p2  ORF type:complete len:639 (-),score=61.78 TRINITY_DN791_c0_g1_i6:596-2512(-)
MHYVQTKMLHKFGCLVISPSINESECTNKGYTWVNTSIHTEEECLAYRGCFDEALQRFDTKNEEQCSCSGNSFRTYFEWATGEYTPGKVRPLVWDIPRWESVRTVSNSLDIIQFAKEISAAVVERIAIDYAKEMTCRYKAEASILYAVSCDCGDEVDANDSCYDIDSTQVSDFIWACPFLNTTGQNLFYNLTIFEDSIPPDHFCQLIYVAIQPHSFYSSSFPDAHLSSFVFTQKPDNPFSVVMYEDLVLEGQVVSDGVALSWKEEIVLDTPLWLCVPVAKSIERSSLFETFSLGVITQKNEHIEIKRLQGSYLSNGNICGEISKPGTYVGLYVRDVAERYRSILAQSMVSSVIYFLLLLGVLYQVLSITLHNIPRKTQKYVFVSIPGLFLLIRGVYFIVYPIGIVEKYPLASYLVFELPTFLFLIMNSTIIYVWLEIIFASNKLLNIRASKKLLMGWIFWNTCILMCFISFLVAYYSQSSYELPCVLYTRAQNPVKVTVSMAYVIFVTALSIIMGIAFLVIGMRFLLPVCSSMQKSQYKLMVVTWLVISVFAICFITKSILLLVVATDNSFSVPVLLFALLEQVPTAVLLYYLRPPVITLASVFPNSDLSKKTSTIKNTSTDKSNPTTNTSQSTAAAE